jgi:hypothetical protein
MYVFINRIVYLIVKLILQKGLLQHKNPFVQESAITIKIKNLNRKSAIDTTKFLS